MLLVDTSGHPSDSTIQVDTRARRPIRNTQSWSLVGWDWKNFADVMKKYPRAKQVSEICPVYNCHGLTFGSRRTTVEYRDISSILTDDGFSQISERDAREGDVVVYFEPTGVVSHSGFIVGKRKVFDASAQELPLVWSKWGKGPEMVHFIADCDFYLGEELVKFYRMTDWEEGWRQHGAHSD